MKFVIAYCGFTCRVLYRSKGTCGSCAAAKILTLEAVEMWISAKSSLVCLWQIEIKQESLEMLDGATRAQIIRLCWFSNVF